MSRYEFEFIPSWRFYRNCEKTILGVSGKLQQISLVKFILFFILIVENLYLFVKIRANLYFIINACVIF